MTTAVILRRAALHGIIARVLPPEGFGGDGHPVRTRGDDVYSEDTDQERLCYSLLRAVVEESSMLAKRYGLSACYYEPRRNGREIDWSAKYGSYVGVTLGGRVLYPEASAGQMVPEHLAARHHPNPGHESWLTAWELEHCYDAGMESRVRRAIHATGTGVDDRGRRVHSRRKISIRRWLEHAPSAVCRQVLRQSGAVDWGKM